MLWKVLEWLVAVIKLGGDDGVCEYSSKAELKLSNLWISNTAGRWEHTTISICFILNFYF